MKAYVCDRCGKAVLIEDFPGIRPEGINYMSESGLLEGGLDLCDECVAELLAAVRTVKEKQNGV